MKLTLKIRLSVSVLCLATCLATFFCGCVSAGDVVYPSLYLKKSANENGVYFACAPSMQTPQRELSECLFRVANQISLRERVFVRYTETIGKKDHGFEPKSITCYLDYDQNNSIALLDDLSVRDVRRTDSGTEALVKLGGKNNFKNASFSLKTWPDSRGNPGWVTSPPKGSHFYAVVGSVRQASAPADAFINADTNAIGSLAVFVANPVISGNTRMYEAVLHGAYIARRWYNAKENAYYSLAILPR